MKDFGDFSGSPVVKTQHFHSRGHRFDPWSGNPICHMVCQKKKKVQDLGLNTCSPSFFKTSTKISGAAFPRRMSSPPGLSYTHFSQVFASNSQ